LDFGVDEAALLGDFIAFYMVPGVKEEFVAEKQNDLVLFWATTPPVCFLALRETAEHSVA